MASPKGKQGWPNGYDRGMEMHGMDTSLTTTDSVVDSAPQSGHATAAVASSSLDAAAAKVIVEEEMLVEEISIDGMCGVY